MSTIDPETGDITSAVCRSLKAVQSFVDTWNRKRNIYWTPHPTPHPSGWRGRCANKDYEWVQVLTVDCDGAYKAGGDNSDILAKLRSLGVTHAVYSGGGVQGYIVLHEPVTKLQAQMMMQWLIEECEGDVGTYTVERLVRVPGTMNLPNQKKRDAGRVEVMATIAFMHDEFTYPWMLEMRPIPKRKGEDMQDVEPDLKLDLDKVVKKYRLYPDLVYLLREGHDEGWTKGEDMSRYVYKAVCALIRKGVPDGTIGAMLLDPDLGISQSLFKKGDDEAWRQMNRAIGRAHDDVPPPRSVADDFDIDAGDVLDG